MQRISVIKKQIYIAPVVHRSSPPFLTVNLLLILGLVILFTVSSEIARAQSTVIYHGSITIDACADLDADGECGPGSDNLPSGTQACLTYEVTGDLLGCKPVPATFEELSPGRHTAYLEFTGASAGYFPTTPPVEINLPGCQCDDCGCTTPNCQCQCECSCSAQVTLGAVYPFHPKGIAVHTGLNKVYAAFQGPKIGDVWPYPFVAVIDSDTDQVVKIISGGPDKIGREPWGVGVSGDYVYVGAGGDEGRVSIIDATTDTVITNVRPNRPTFQPTSPYVNPTTGWVHFADRQGWAVIFDDLNIIHDLSITQNNGDGFILTPFEVVVADDGGEGHNFATERDALGPNNSLLPFKFAGFTSNPFGLTYYDILESDGSTTGSPHAIGLWPDGPGGKSRLFITYSDDDPRSHFGDPTYFANPGKLQISEFPAAAPQNVTRVQQVGLDVDYAEVGLVYDPQNERMVGTYAGFPYRGELGDVAACDNPSRGGTYALDFDGTLLSGDAPNVWRLPRKVVGNPPLEADNLQWRNPFEIAINPNNGKVYVTDRCWNEFPTGGQPGGGGVLVFYSDGNSGGQPAGNVANFLPVILKSTD